MTSHCRLQTANELRQNWPHLIRICIFFFFPSLLHVTFSLFVVLSEGSPQRGVSELLKRTNTHPHTNVSYQHRKGLRSLISCVKLLQIRVPRFRLGGEKLSKRKPSFVCPKGQKERMRVTFWNWSESWQEGAVHRVRCWTRLPSSSKVWGSNLSSSLPVWNLHGMC